MWWPAVGGEGQLLFSQLPKLLSSSNYMSVVDRGEISALNQHIAQSEHMSRHLVLTRLCQSLRSLLVRW